MTIKHPIMILGLALWAAPLDGLLAGDPDKPEPAEEPAFKVDGSVNPEDVPPPPPLEGGNDCFARRSVHDFEVLDRNHLVVFAPSKRHPYLVEVSRTCMGLQFSDTIAFDSRDSRICSYGGDDILVERSRCPITSITKLDETSYELAKAQYSNRRQ